MEFEVVDPRIDELGSGEPEQVVLENALRKARAGRAAVPRAVLVLGADTEVVLDGRVLGKAASAAEARERLLTLSGRTHEVLGAVAISGRDGTERTAIDRTEVTFCEIPGRLLDAYIGSGEWEGRAGAYAVQGLGSALVDRVDGDLANVIGLPLRALLELAPELRPGRQGRARDGKGVS